MTKYLSLLIILLGIFLIGIFYFAIHWFHEHPHWQDRNVIYARKVLGKGLKIALNGIDWNHNQIPECVAFIPSKKLQKVAPHLQAIHQLCVIEKDSVLFHWASKDTIAFIPIQNSLDLFYIPIIFSNHRLDSLNLHSIYYLKYNKHSFQIVQSNDGDF